jgi:hypothetical protein
VYLYSLHAPIVYIEAIATVKVAEPPLTVFPACFRVCPADVFVADTDFARFAPAYAEVLAKGELTRSLLVTEGDIQEDAVNGFGGRALIHLSELFARHGADRFDSYLATSATHPN